MIELLDYFWIFFALFLVGMAKSEGKGMGRDISTIKSSAEKDDESFLYEWIVKIRDEGLQRVLADKKESWERWKGELGFEIPYEATEEFRRVISKHTSLSATEAVDKEKWALMRYFGADAEDPKLKHFKLVKWFIQYVQNRTREVLQIYLIGEQGAGKTDFALLIAEVWLLVHPKGRIVTNIKSAAKSNERFVYTPNQDALDQWLQDHNHPFLFVFDEANKHASGIGGEEVIEQLYPLLTLIRKHEGNIIIIGHTSKDIHGWVRELCDFIIKEGKKTARVYEDNEDGEGKHLKRALRAIPKTTFEYDSLNDEGEWSWSSERETKCFGTNKEGERCSTVCRSDYGDEHEYLCSSHQDQDEPHEDVKPIELYGTPFEEYIEDDEWEPVDEVEYEIFDLEDEEEEEDDNEDTEPPALLPAPEIEPELYERIISGGEDESDIEARESSEETTNPTRREFISGFRDRGKEVMDAVDEKLVERADESKADDEPPLDDVPEEYWDKLRERTGGITKHDVEDLAHLEQLLSDRQFNRLMNRIE
ncbi:ATP-binding protein [Halorubrum vacuolatum]|uniref:Uncharacterized protein n=1 Tax=Halorubrum vacuolatum TaxID=63740 RepID=A0A238WTK3_HALVU|nr:ATP-binding protein [Halorubrum vacuolatum]SNR49748.1 hypothetical protein SAMN06264855_11017 [Halorubrum vacuolatum]